MYDETEVLIKWALARSKAITWDTCHKIYVVVDDEQVEQFKSFGYDPIIPITDVEEAFNTLHEWYRESCGLRFISAVHTDEDNPNAGFSSIVPQGATWERLSAPAPIVQETEQVVQETEQEEREWEAYSTLTIHVKSRVMAKTAEQAEVRLLSTNWETIFDYDHNVIVVSADGLSHSINRIEEA